MTVYGPTRVLHSGHYGNWAPNPAMRLAHLLATMRDDEGRIRIEGFAKLAGPLTESERQAVAAAPRVDERLRVELGLGASERPGLRLEEATLEPAMNVRGIRAGQVGRKAQNAIPTEATASIDFRLVPELSPEAVRLLVEKHVRARGYHIVASDPDAETRRSHDRIVKLRWESGYPAYRVSMDHPASRAVIRVVEDVTGGPVVAIPTLGGSLPLHIFDEVVGVPLVIVPIVNHDNNQHAPDENLRLQNLWDGIEVYAGLVALLGAAWE